MLFLDGDCQVGFVFIARLSFHCKERLNPAGFAQWGCVTGPDSAPLGAGSKQIVSKVCVQRAFLKGLLISLGALPTNR